MLETYSQTPAFGGISLALRRSGAVDATFGRLGCHRLGACRAHLGDRRLRRRWKKRVWNKYKKFGASWAPHIWAAPANIALGGDKKEEKQIGVPSAPQFSGVSGAPFRGAWGAPNGFKNVTRSTRIPNMCLVLKLDNGKVVSIANGQNHRRTYHPVQY